MEDGSKPTREGVTRALRFWVMVSSMAERETRRKSRRAAVEKQNWGVSAGADGALVGWTMVFLGLGFSTGGAAVWPAVAAASPFCVVQRRFATLSLLV